jgi:hypothetical protein
MLFDLRVFELHFEVGDLRARGIAIGDGGFKRALHIGIIECREDLAFFNVHAFVEEHAGYAPGDFRSDRRAAPRRDVPAGVQQGRAASRGFLRDGNFDDRLLVAIGQRGSGDQCEDYYDGRDNTPALAAFFGLALGLIDAQRTQIRFCLRRRGHVRPVLLRLGARTTNLSTRDGPQK